MPQLPVGDLFAVHKRAEPSSDHDEVLLAITDDFCVVAHIGARQAHVRLLRRPSVVTASSMDSTRLPDGSVTSTARHHPFLRRKRRQTSTTVASPAIDHDSHRGARPAAA